MKELPVLFKPHLVREIIAKRKTQTRRIIPLGKILHAVNSIQFLPELDDDQSPGWFALDIMRGFDEFNELCAYTRLTCRHGDIGDHLWVKETWKYCDWTEDGYPFLLYKADNTRRLIESGYDSEWGERLSAIWAELSAPSNYNIDGSASDRKWRPSIYLPRWASRITLEVTSIRVERIQDITEDDVIAEGINPIDDSGCPCEGPLDDPGNHIAACPWSHPDIDPENEPHRAAFAVTWDAINGARASWADNPWVWVIGFKLLELRK